MIEYQVADRKGSGYLALPPSGTGPGVIVLHTSWGFTNFFRSVCDRLAETGFVTFAPDLYQGKSATTIAEGRQLRDALNIDHAIQDILAAISYVRGLPNTIGEKIGAIGFSMGGSFALGLSIDIPEIAAVVTFYGIEPEFDYAPSHAAYLGHFAALDTIAPIEDVALMEEALRTASKDFTFYEYPGAKHWFFEADRPEVYDPQAAQLAWERTVAFLRSTL